MCPIDCSQAARTFPRLFRPLCFNIISVDPWLEYETCLSGHSKGTLNFMILESGTPVQWVIKKQWLVSPPDNFPPRRQKLTFEEHSTLANIAWPLDWPLQWLYLWFTHFIVVKSVFNKQLRFSSPDNFPTRGQKLVFEEQSTVLAIGLASTMILSLSFNISKLYFW